MLNLKMSQNKSDPFQHPPHQLPPLLHQYCYVSLQGQMISMTTEMEDLMMNMLHIRRNLVTPEETADHRGS